MNALKKNRLYSNASPQLKARGKQSKQMCHKSIQSWDALFMNTANRFNYTYQLVFSLLFIISIYCLFKIQILMQNSLLFNLFEKNN